jgi:hypothetical protein
MKNGFSAAAKLIEELLRSACRHWWVEHRQWGDDVDEAYGTLQRLGKRDRFLETAPCGATAIDRNQNALVHTFSASKRILRSM